jgi:uncharacterized protein YndB with AHSA1/START domain
MSATLPTGFQIAGREITITRVLNAPCELVFRAFTDPEHLMRWWGPSQWPVAVCTVDLRPGGKWLYCMKSRETGDEAWGLGLYSEVIPPERIVYTDAFCDAEGNINSELPTSQITMNFANEAGKTRVTMTTLYGTEADLQTVVQMGMIEGISETLGQLEALLAELQRA